MLFDIVTIFPNFFDSPLKDGVVRRAIEADILKVRTINLRDFTTDRHRTVDDRPFGGGEGMVMKPEPIYRALKVLKEEPPEARVILLSPRGKLLDQALAGELARFERLILICGRYEGVDERIREHCVDLELSVGDYVLSGGEIAALVLIEAVGRLIPGVLGCESSAEKDSFSDGLLEFPQYTRPRIFKGWEVPEVLMSGDHARIARWRREQSLGLTYEQRPELLNRAGLDENDIKYLRSLGWEES
ncbi:MAG: tRNA (guanosine(37)-N1)-methyltransferase TrmD [Deltaproteobacteria bacterium]|nr:tRNA (guanosine(37)-N1)-methyltransferase TrmD [Deltaproteobacteria bacterium]MBW1966946.1 tRNA (guanosine(37)-N1)-methyltransferase TrmD [Deltaproteobacteria bacterium]MBW2097410.1 tRNA (guanosine(37)-N1)-methyltransferase TrmD [Deltaproteobacteria bacterium]